jgi:hypothetical protein
VSLRQDKQASSPRPLSTSHPRTWAPIMGSPQKSRPEHGPCMGLRGDHASSGLCSEQTQDRQATPRSRFPLLPSPMSGGPAARRITEFFRAKGPSASGRSIPFEEDA